jgi:hypothetical protein
MELQYFKRYRMEISAVGQEFPAPVLPAGYRFRGWSPDLLDAFALTKYLSFRGEIDSHVFPCLGDLAGCRRLMTEISRKPGFLPEATWLIEDLASCDAPRYCGTIQGIRDASGQGAIQNLGTIPECRNFGLGAALLCQAMAGFRHAGLNRVYLEVTAENTGAIRLYRRFGFVTAKTVYKAVEAAYL